MLKGKVALITGGSRGVGLAIARAVAAEGMTVGVMARNAEQVAAAASEVARHGGIAQPLVGDVSVEADVNRCVAQLVRAFGRLDPLVNNAGVSGRGRVETVPVETWRKTIETNLIGPYLCARAAIPHLRAAGGGWIIGIASGAGKRGYPELSAYCASKFGLIGLDESLAQELQADRIKVSTIVLGTVMTDFGTRTRADKEASQARGEKFMAPEDVAHVVLAILRQSPQAWLQEVHLWPY